MKLSFSTKGWHNTDWATLCDTAQELQFGGIELHNINGALIADKNGAFQPHSMTATLRLLYEKNLKIPCVDTICNLGDRNAEAEIKREFAACLTLSTGLRVPYIRVHALPVADTDFEAQNAFVLEILSALLCDAKQAGITVLLESSGIYSSTDRLSAVLDYFATDYLGVLWDMCATALVAGESAQKSIQNLGAYVHHVRIRDARKNENGVLEPCLIGEGELPVEQMMNALRSVNYNGFLSLEWDPSWMPELDDMELIFSHFENHMRRFGDTARSKNALYYNRAGTGRFVWKKDALIHETFPQVLDRMVEEFPDQQAFRYTTLDYTRTYAEFRDDVDDFARALVALGVKPGSHVSVWATNLPQWYITFWATTKIGAVLVTMNTAYKIHEAEYLLRQSDTHTLVMMEGYRDSDYRGIMKELCPEIERREKGKSLHCKRLPFLRNIVTIGYAEKGCVTWDEALSMGERVKREEVDRLAAAVDRNDVCNMQYTSGTTGFPKGVMLTHYNVVNDGKCIGDRMDLSTADRMMVQVPMFHCFGMVLAMTATMTHGGTLCPLPYFSPKPALACINAEKITAFHGVPTMFIAMLEHPDFDKTDFSHVRTGIMAGSPCPVPVMKDVVSKMNMREIVIVYGQTESSPGCTMSATDDPLEVRVSTVGRAMPEISCKIVDPETGEDCPDEVTGEFVARGYNIMKGYYKMPEETAKAIDADGWLHTGDLACRTKDGNYRITGRLKDMIIRGGENIYPKEIEEFIYTHPKVRDVQVIGVPDEQYGEEIMACIILKEGESMTADEMKQFVLDHMAKHKVPRYIDFVDSFPMNDAGKIQKYKMREDAVKKLGLQKAQSIETA